MLVVGVGLAVGELHHIGNLGDTPGVAGNLSDAAGFQHGTVGFVIFVGQPGRLDTGVTPGPDVLDKGNVFLAVVGGGFTYFHPVLFVLREAETVIVGLDGVVPLIGRTLGLEAVVAVP